MSAQGQLIPFGANAPDVPIDTRAQRIRDLVNVARGCIIEIGRELIAAKAELRHGAWLPWLEREFGWTERTAQKYMAVGNAFGKYELGSHLSDLTIEGSALYTLSAPDVPQAVRDEAIARAEAGERISKQEAEAMVDAAVREAVEKAIATERASLAEEVAANEGRIRDLSARLDETKSSDDALNEANELLLDLERRVKAATEQRDAAQKELDDPSDAQVLRLVRALTRRAPGRVMLVTIASALGREITYDGQVYQPMTETDLEKFQKTRAASEKKLASLNDPNGAAARWHRVLMVLRELNQLEPVESLMGDRYRGFDHALSAELPSAKRWLDAFTEGMADELVGNTESDNSAHEGRGESGERPT